MRMILATVGQTITLAQAEFESKRSRRAAAEEAAPAEAPPAEPAPVAVAFRLRPLRRRRLDLPRPGRVFRLPSTLNFQPTTILYVSNYCC
jgi:hypothetical protein